MEFPPVDMHQKPFWVLGKHEPQQVQNSRHSLSDVGPRDEIQFPVP